MHPFFLSRPFRTLFVTALLAGSFVSSAAISVQIPAADLELKSPRYAPALQSLRRSDFHEVHRLAGALLAENEKDSSAHLLRALAYVGQEKHLQAIDQAVAARGAEGRDAVAILRVLATTYARSSRPYLAYACLQRARTIGTTPAIDRDLALIYLGQGRVAKARALLEGLPPEHADPEALSRCCLMLGDLPAAQAAARRALELDPKNHRALLLRGTAELLAGETAAAATFRQLTENSDGAALVGHYVGLAAFARRDYGTALTAMQSLLQKHPGLREAHLIAGLSLQMQSRHEEARSSAEAVLAGNPQDAVASLLLAAAEKGAGRKDEALRALHRSDAVLIEFETPSAGGARDWTAAQAGQFAAATFLLTEGLARDARSWATDGDTTADPLLALIAVRADLALGRREAVSAACTALVERHPQLVTPLTELAQLAATEARAGQVRAHLQAAVARSGASVRLQLVAGEIAYRSGLYDLAETCFRRVIVLDPSSAVGHNQLAWTLADKLRRPAEALPLAKTALNLSPRNPNSIDTLAWTNHLLGDDLEALRLYQPLLKALPINPSTLHRMALVHEKVGRKGIAAELYEKALSISDDFPEAAASEQSLHAIWATF
ncbi:tetratricopeptide repeat protein [Oleiharenicola lentus]|uniref:Tetratricopeptide repeat protein n=1 Tax=Oleiharenicola lentus TaxID=2508720 RepID=A0A4V1M6G3_9BACT|nr:tetratricopeptide repeat protein [Oleiharenicola lentus]RXK55299.1 tetratricopeptide repeat protein [Oleiharenicola lentus]